MKTLRLFVLIALLCNLYSLKAANPSKVQQFINHKDWNFVENKGQLVDQNRNPQSEIKYYGHQGGVYLYCKPGMLSFVFTKTESKEPEQISEATGSGIASPFGGGRGRNSAPQPSTISISRTDLVLLNANPNAEIIASDRQEYYENFYTTGDADHGITNVHTFKTITYKSIYSNIDMVLQAKDQGMEYSFIVHPGGKTSDIQMQWNGIEGAQALANGGYNFTNSLGSLKESAPKSFVGGKRVASQFINDGNSYGFNVSEYNKGKDLVIDPTLIWATYDGNSFNSGAIYSVFLDNSGNICFTGYTGGSSGLATSGAYHTAEQGNFDAVVAKFTNTGKPVWSTYFGGSDYDNAYGVSSDTHGNLFVCGYTKSTSGIATSGAFQTSFITGSSPLPYDAFLAKFDNSGNLDWSTYFGGGDIAFASGVIADTSGNAYMTGYVSGYTNIATTGAYQTSFGGGDQDAFLAKFSSSGNRIWSTFFGGSDDDFGMGINIDKSGYLYITGYTPSEKGITTSGAYQSTLGSGTASYLAKFNSSGSIVWGTYYGGNENSAQCVNTDRKGNIYIAGYTYGSSGISTSGVHQTSYGGGADAFVAKFTQKGILTWGTYYGGGRDDEAFGICADSIGNVYVSGYTQSNTGIATTGAYITSYSTGINAFLAKFRSNGSLNWGTYYAGSSQPNIYINDIGFSLASDTLENVYMGGETYDDSMATSGAFQTSFADIILSKFGFHPYKNSAGIMSILNPPSIFCAGSYPVKVSLQNFGSQNLDSVRINWSVDNKIQPVYYWKGSLKPNDTVSVKISNFSFKAGIAFVKAWTTRPNGLTDSVPLIDTTVIRDSINSVPLAKILASDTICSGTQISLGGSSVTGDKYSWTSSVSGFTSTISNPTVSPNSTRTYTLTETNAIGCSNSNSDTITVNALPAASVISNTVICIGSTISIGAATVTGSTYSWTNTVSGFTSTAANPTDSPTSTSTYTLTETNSNGCSKTHSVTVTVNIPVASVISNTAICTGNSVSIGKAPVSGSTYSWISSVSGFSSTASNPSVSPTSTSTYTLTETNSNGCVKSDAVKITVNPLPAASVISNATICSGTSISIGGTSVPGSSYSWVSSDPGFGSVIANPSVSPTSTNTYTITERNSNGCMKSDSVTITTKPIPAASVISNTTICPGNSISIGSTAVSGSTYSWTSTVSGYGSTLSNPIVSPVSAAIYTLTETNSVGCSKSNSVKIIVDNLPAASVISNTAICIGNAISIGDTTVTGSSYRWTSSVSGFSSTVADPSVSPTTVSSYTLTETDIHGCSNSNSVTITIHALPAASVISNTAICIGSSISIGAANVTGSRYSWVSTVPGFGSTVANPSVSPTSTSTYTLTETNSNGCSKTDTTTITVNTPPDKYTDTASFCNQATLQMPSGQPYKYLWQNVTPIDSSSSHLLKIAEFNSLRNACPLCSVLTFNVNVTNIYGCASISTIYVKYPKQITISQPSICLVTVDTLQHNQLTIEKPDSIIDSIGILKFKGNDWHIIGMIHRNHILQFTDNNSNVTAQTSTYRVVSYATDPCLDNVVTSDSSTAHTTILLQVSYTSQGLYALNWTPYVGLSSSDLLGYYIYKGTSPNDLKPYDTTQSILNTAYVDIKDSTDALNYYFVEATKKSGCDETAQLKRAPNTPIRSNSIYTKVLKGSINISNQPGSLNLQVFPNPFHTSATIRYSLPNNSDIHLSLYDLNGKLISVLADQKQMKGNYQLDINAEKYHLNPGVYLLKFMAGDAVENKRVVLY